MKKSVKGLILILCIPAIILTLQSCGCQYNCDPGYELKVLRDVPDTTLQVGDTLRMDMRNYYEIVGNGQLITHPGIWPTIEDTSVVNLAYDLYEDYMGSGFLVAAIDTGTTTITLELLWDDGPEMDFAHKFFDITVTN